MDGSTAAVIALISGIQLLALTFLQGYVSERKNRKNALIRHDERQEDYARQDVVAKRITDAASIAAQRTARLLADAQAQTIKKTDEVAAAAAVSDEKVQAQLTSMNDLAKKIH